MGLKIVYIADDDESYRELIEVVLEMHCHIKQVRAFSGGRDLLHAVDNESLPDLVLLDFHMPDMKGLTVLQELQSRGHQVPVAVISGAADHQEQDACLASGAMAFVSKPARVEDLIGALQKIIEGLRS